MSMVVGECNENLDRELCKYRKLVYEYSAVFIACRSCSLYTLGHVLITKKVFWCFWDLSNL